ncbi:hypothetical protein KIH74_20625 [Kineosporia sp. J2-2]|uniref:Uncharacterized protein n=1 Tax=Kineosporia corallincola TaxID=2835133 RepID=A0ABS5TK15_9ACTN|nr:hypothetical protein [Kineosporia corallincola]MBT0771355.1 hypothetical protein [Kineosporia corallincola]
MASKDEAAMKKVSQASRELTAALMESYRSKRVDAAVEALQAARKAAGLDRPRNGTAGQ